MDNEDSMVLASPMKNEDGTYMAASCIENTDNDISDYSGQAYHENEGGGDNLNNADLNFDH